MPTLAVRGGGSGLIPVESISDASERNHENSLLLGCQTPGVDSTDVDPNIFSMHISMYIRSSHVFTRVGYFFSGR
jgi:hypothetical protein